VSEWVEFNAATYTTHVILEAESAFAAPSPLRAHVSQVDKFSLAQNCGANLSVKLHLRDKLTNRQTDTFVRSVRQGRPSYGERARRDAS